VTNADGHLFFGENDNLGHLWMYFPPLRPAAGPVSVRTPAGGR
jgi:hypothetical protein